jgi:hypothetical protein
MYMVRLSRRTDTHVYPLRSGRRFVWHFCEIYAHSHSCCGATHGQHRHQTSATHLRRAYLRYVCWEQDGQRETKQVYGL